MQNNPSAQFAALFITLGIVMIAIGLLFRFGFPLLPGDILIRKEKMTFYFPAVTCIIISVVLTIFLNLFRR